MSMILMIADAPAQASHFPFSATLTLILGFIAAAGVGSLAWFRARRPLGWKEEKPTGTTNKPGAGYDRGIVPAETKARQQREGQVYKEIPQPEGQPATTGGFTTDREGLINNYAVEPEMYVEQPGDLRKAQEASAEERAQELQEVNEPGGKGPGVV